MWRSAAVHSTGSRRFLVKRAASINLPGLVRAALMKAMSMNPAELTRAFQICWPGPSASPAQMVGALPETSTRAAVLTLDWRHLGHAAGWRSARVEDRTQLWCATV